MKKELVLTAFFTSLMFGTVLVNAETMDVSDLKDGVYQIDITMEGGSGRAHVQSPAKMMIEDGNATAEIVWSSPNYDYMVVDGTKYNPVNTEGNSTFEIPIVEFDAAIPVIGDTVAMSEPHEIEYSFLFASDSIAPAAETEEKNADETQNNETDAENQNVTDTENQTGKGEESQTDEEAEETFQQDEAEINEIPVTEIPGLTYESRLELQYAKQFAVDYYADGYKLLTIQDTGKFLVIPEGEVVPEGIDEEITVLSGPVSNIYLVATSAMDFFDKLDALSSISLSGTNANGWYIENAKKALEDNVITYAGKYSAPDYEMIVSQGCKLAIESTMIYHTPDVKEKLEKLGVPVMVERSSYENHPLGRMEWIKFYGALVGKEEEAEKFYTEQLDVYAGVEQAEKTDQTVGFFYINTAGTVNIRKPGDYVSKMIELSGGNYVFDNLAQEEENSLATMNITLEDFYVGAKDADYLIYNSTIDGEVKNLTELLAKCPLLADFKAVQNKNVWCTQKSLFQESTGLAVMMLDMHNMLTGEADTDQLTYMYRLQ
ncbi:MAG: ABC transporter substrate-binding protein [Eubacteriales bacterium]|nr:ABC transporter substrate-binding protein [Eubacteriales bacterium]